MTNSEAWDAVEAYCGRSFGAAPPIEVVAAVTNTQENGRLTYRARTLCDPYRLAPQPPERLTP